VWWFDEEDILFGDVTEWRVIAVLLREEWKFEDWELEG